MSDVVTAEDVTDPVSIGKRLKAKREELDLTQVQLAARLGVSPKTYIFYENGKRAVGLKLILAMNALYRVHPDYLLFGIEHARHEFGALKDFIATFLDQLADEEVDLPPESCAAIVADWYREFTLGKALPVEVAMFSARQVVANSKKLSARRDT
ncbi:helix-turn-helix transcriptional regulator [Yoonia sp. SS1-5]|uniref:Helix-turn-helix domain-containing protein n=1 Tax=Yoonia rhodophyticola TaxID=3137370 RepID=A0AAN0M6G2_9RHOB